MRHILIILSILLLFSSIFISCKSTDSTTSTDNTTTTDTTPTSPWTKQLGSISRDSGLGVTTDSSGNIYVTGETYGGLDGNTNSGSNDIFLVKYNSSGTKQWTEQLGSISRDYGQGVTTDSSGNIYVTGLTNGGLDGNSNSGNTDIFLVKYNSSGTKQWTEQLGTVYNDHGEGVTTDSSGNIYVTGSTDGGLVDGNTNSSNSNTFIVKYNSSGIRQWTKQFGSYSIGHGITTDSSGNIYVTGRTNRGLHGNTDLGSSDIFLVKYDSSGIRQWTKQLGTSSDEWGKDVTTDSSGNIYVTGFTSGGLHGNTNSGSSDIFLVKYNSSGMRQWTKQLGTSSSDSGLGVTTDSSGNIYVTGTTEGGLDGNTDSGSSDIFLVKYNSSVTKQWTEQLGEEYLDDVGSGVTTDSSGNIYVTGYTYGGLDGNTNSGSSDIFLVKYNSSGINQ
ncbi:MAG: SBBP repeat-containing protein [SAR324 cluster bacterium]|nr:SBBP repeat-containing protein [SAR324 cluster bacterium]